MRLTKNASTAARALFFPAVVFLFQFAADIVLNAYKVIPQFDAILHLLGGLAIGLGMAEIIREWQARGHLKKKMHRGIFIFFSVSGTGLVAIVWEWYEFLVDTFFLTNNQPNIADTMADFFLGLFGALLISMWISKKYLR